MPNLNEQDRADPCPFCGAEISDAGHPHNDCWLSGVMIAKDDIASWNRRQHGSAAQAVAWRYQRDTQSNPGVPDGEWKFMAHGDDALDLQGKRLGWKPNDSYHCWEPLFTAPPVGCVNNTQPVADAEVELDRIDRIVHNADEARSNDEIVEAIRTTLSRRPAAAPELRMLVEVGGKLTLEDDNVTVTGFTFDGYGNEGLTHVDTLKAVRAWANVRIDEQIVRLEEHYAKRFLHNDVKM